MKNVAPNFYSNQRTEFQLQGSTTHQVDQFLLHLLETVIDILTLEQIKVKLYIITVSIGVSIYQKFPPPTPASFDINLLEEFTHPENLLPATIFYPELLTEESNMWEFSSKMKRESFSFVLFRVPW